MRARRPPREELLDRFAPGASVADVGCMWQVHGGLAFAAEAAGAARVTGLDLMPPTPEFRAEHERRRSAVRFVQGDLHDPAVVAEVGVHDVVWCSGVLYHVPHPLLALERLRALTGRTLLLACETVPGRRRTLELAPDPGRHPAHTQPFDPAGGYGPWWWAITPPALRALVEVSGFRVEEEHATRWHRTLVATVT